MLGPLFNSSNYFSISAGRNSIPRSCPADFQRETFSQDPIFEMASSITAFDTIHCYKENLTTQLGYNLMLNDLGRNVVVLSVT